MTDLFGNEIASAEPATNGQCYMALCPMCDGKIGASVIDLDDDEMMRYATRDSKQWKRSGYVVRVVGIDDMNARGKFGHQGDCRFPGRR